MSFYIDLSKITLGEYKRRLKEEYLLPSQQKLKENTDEHFSRFTELGMQTMSDLNDAMKSKKKFADLLDKTKIPEDYLTVLRREIQSYHPALRKFSDFSVIDESLVSKLLELGYKTTKDFYPVILRADQRKEMSEKTGADLKTIELLARFCDFTRIRYVNHNFAHWLTLTEFDSTERLKEADPEELLKQLNEQNKDKRFMKNSLGLNDMKFLVRDTRDIDLEIQY